MVNFIDHKTNYTRVFLARTKDQAAKKFEHFLVFFEKRFDCRIHVLRIDGVESTRMSTLSVSPQECAVKSANLQIKRQTEKLNACTEPC